VLVQLDQHGIPSESQLFCSSLPCVHSVYLPLFTLRYVYFVSLSVYCMRSALLVAVPSPVPHTLNTDNSNGLGMDSNIVIAIKALYRPPTGIPLEMPPTVRIWFPFIYISSCIYSSCTKSLSEYFGDLSRNDTTNIPTLTYY